MASKAQYCSICKELIDPNNEFNRWYHWKGHCEGNSSIVEDWAESAWDEQQKRINNINQYLDTTVEREHKTVGKLEQKIDKLKKKKKKLKNELTELRETCKILREQNAYLLDQQKSK